MRFPYGARYFWGNTIEIRELFKYRWRPLSASRYSTKCRKLSNKYEKKRRKKENDGTEKDEGKETKIYLRVPLIIVREKLEAVDAVFHWTFVSKWERIVCWTNDAAIAVPNLSDLSERIFFPRNTNRHRNIIVLLAEFTIRLMELLHTIKYFYRSKKTQKYLISFLQSRLLPRWTFHRRDSPSFKLYVSIVVTRKFSRQNLRATSVPPSYTYLYSAK